MTQVAINTPLAPWGSKPGEPASTAGAVMRGREGAAHMDITPGSPGAGRGPGGRDTGRNTQQGETHIHAVLKADAAHSAEWSAVLLLMYTRAQRSAKYSQSTNTNSLPRQFLDKFFGQLH